jgi:hypothetical protein
MATQIKFEREMAITIMTRILSPSPLCHMWLGEAARILKANNRMLSSKLVTSPNATVSIGD